MFYSVMEIYFKSLLCAISEALDYVENSLFGATKNHAKRVAFMAASMGKAAGLSDNELSDISACALLHDNALTEYIHTELASGMNILLTPESTSLGEHCTFGERNISAMPFYPRIKNVIKYHHERPDGKGPFKKKSDDIPLYSRIIHLADLVDVGYPPGKNNGDREELIRAFLKKYRGTQFDSSAEDLFLSCIDQGMIERTEQEDPFDLLNSVFPEMDCSYGKDEIISIATLFAKIIDYKSTFTSMHSLGIAQKALRMAQFYGWDDETQAKYYLAGALHDIGKLTVETDILEKPGKLTEGEYKKIQYHAYATWEILHKIDGFTDITEWASFHHEKLDGTGYPFGKKASELSQKARLMACLDTYQALRESRPYKKELSHEEAMRFLYGQADLGKLDRMCVNDIDTCFGKDV
jgi:HD-GYP domain-containing protein (c-di-GMP phosphodiesterase class II)